MSRSRMNAVVSMRAVLAAAAATLVLAGCAGSPPAPGPVPSSTGLYVEPDSKAAAQAAEWDAEGRAGDAAKMRAIAAQPVAYWLTKPNGHAGADVAQFVAKAKAAGQRPLMVVYHIPERDCGSFSGGGADDSEDYRAWIREVADAMQGSRAMVVLEPDAVPHLLGGCVEQDHDRSALLADAVDQLKGAGATVYIDAGNPGFVEDIGALADALRRSGVEKSDGFSLNVANFYPTDENLVYGRKLSAALGGAHFVVDTGRNGNGRAQGDGDIDGGPAFCNPPGRALGQAPTTDTGEPLADDYLWIKRVGESDGACRPGEPEAGKWWPEYALGLASSS